MTLTFVTYYFKNSLKESIDKTFYERLLQNFKYIAETGISICVCTDQTSFPDIQHLPQIYTNVKITKMYTSVNDLNSFRLCNEQQGQYTLPDIRNTEKDDDYFLALINAKVEFLHAVILENPFQSTHFAWIDFGIFKICQNIPLCQDKLKMLSNSHLLENFTCFPGCWDKEVGLDMDSLLNNVNWRFCGGFFVGDARSLIRFYDLCQIHFKEILVNHKKLVWEVNVWKHIEATTDWRPHWYSTVFDDRIFDMPSRFVVNNDNCLQLRDNIYTNKGSLTFVTCYFRNSTIKNNLNYYELILENFLHIVNSGVRICICTDQTSFPDIQHLPQIYTNVKITKMYTSVNDLNSFRLCNEQQGQYTLPDIRNTEKDDDYFLALINAKVEFLHAVILENPFQSTHFAWIDFGIFKICQNIPLCQDKLKMLSNSHLLENFTCFPGCWDKGVGLDMNNVNWRFCGGFFVGDARSLIRFYDLCQIHFKEILVNHKKLVWEGNVWKHIESTTDWRPIWYESDHNDRIFDMPSWVYSKCLANSPHIVKQSVLHEKINELINGEDGRKKFNLSSISSCEVIEKNQINHYILIRCVNYKMLNNGCYNFFSKNNVILNRSILCKIQMGDDCCKSPLFEIENVVEIKEDKNLKEENPNAISKGMEDIRIYPTKNGGGIGFIGCSLNYSTSQGSQLFMGDIEIETTDDNVYSGCMSNVQRIKYQNKEWEKNWIPLPGGRIIYEWCPFQIGKVNENGELNICQTINTENNYILSQSKGSSMFIPWKYGRFLGVVHFHKEYHPRKYYHCLVELAYNSEIEEYVIVRNSIPFHFSVIGVEYCIGFNVWQGNYLFWVSEFDREPYLLSVPIKNIDFV